MKNANLLGFKLLNSQQASVKTTSSPVLTAKIGKGIGKMPSSIKSTAKVGGDGPL